MNFQKIPPVYTSDQLLDLAFGKARKKNKAKKIEGERLEIYQKKECSKLDIIKDNMSDRLQQILADFPSFDSMNNFYNKLVRLTLDYSELKKSLGAVNWALKTLRVLHKDYVRKIAKTQDISKVISLSKEFYGRISSIIKQINPNLHFLERARRIMRTYPDVKEIFTVCVYGFPNVGKTTLLNKLTGAQAKVASYAFTTQTINSGFVTLDGTKIQVLDVPGTLARDDKMNLIEIQAELVRKELANIIVYVFDVTESSGYSLEKQEQLFKKLGKDKKVLVYLSKQDIASPDQLKDLKHDIVDLAQLKEQIKALAAKEKL